MGNKSPIISDATGARHFACMPVAVQAIIVNSEERVLLLSSPIKNQDGSWQVISGAIESEETIIETVLRETGEEIGSAALVRPLGAVHVDSFHYDDSVRFMVAVYYLLEYKSGKIEPGDDMAGSHYRWWTIEELTLEEVSVKVPPRQIWLIERALDLYRLWKDQDIDLQPPLD